MPRYNVNKINFLITGSTQTIFNISINKNGRNESVTMFTNVDNDDYKMEEKDFYPNNHSSIKSKLNSTVDIIHSIYDVKDLCIKSNNKKLINNEHSYLTNMSENHIDTYCPELTKDFMSICVYNNSIYGLTYKTSSGFLDKQTDIENLNNKVTTIIYSEKIINNPTRVNFYTPNLLSNSSLQDYFEVSATYKNMPYNYIYEIPHSNMTINNFEFGDIYGNFYVCKNEYNPKYSMEIINNSFNCRDYIHIGNCSNCIFLTYYFPSKYKFNYQHVETINSTIKLNTYTKHKSNMYSIKLLDTGINRIISNEQTNKDPIIKNIYDKIALDINNNIRNILKKVCPINSELFNVYFVGE